MNSSNKDRDLSSKKLQMEKEGAEILSESEMTERKQMEEALKASEVRYRRLFETAKDGILILDANTGEITDANPFIEHDLEG